MRGIVTIGLATLVAAAVPGIANAQTAGFWDEVRQPGLAAYQVKLRTARRLLNSGNPESAFARATEAMTRFPERPEAHVVRGLALDGLRRGPEAVVAFARALSASAQALDSLSEGAAAARISVNNGAYPLASRILVRVLGQMQRNHERGRLYAMAGWVWMAAGPDQLQSAVVAFREASASGPSDPLVRLGLALALRRDGRLEEALRVADEVHTQLTTQTLARLRGPTCEQAAYRAVAAQARGDQEGALRAWREAARGGSWQAHAERERQALSGASR